MLAPHCIVSPILFSVQDLKPAMQRQLTAEQKAKIQIINAVLTPSQIHKLHNLELTQSQLEQFLSMEPYAARALLCKSPNTIKNELTVSEPTDSEDAALFEDVLDGIGAVMSSSLGPALIILLNRAATLRKCDSNSSNSN